MIQLVELWDSKFGDHHSGLRAISRYFKESLKVRASTRDSERAQVGVVFSPVYIFISLGYNLYVDCKGVEHA